MIKLVLGGLVVAFVILMVIGGLTGRVRAQSCCGIADADKDLRMRTPETSLPEAETA